jgi:hypothetical protein
LIGRQGPIVLAANPMGDTLNSWAAGSDFTLAGLQLPKKLPLKVKAPEFALRV